MTALAAPPLRQRARWAGVHDAVSLFILERRAERRRPATIRDYDHHLGQFCAWVREQDVEGDGVEDVSKAVVLAYRLHLEDRPRLDGRAGLVENSSGGVTDGGGTPMTPRPPTIPPRIRHADDAH